MQDPTETRIKFEVNLEEANTIFKALGKEPFAKVFELIGKLNEQANAQLQSEQNIFGQEKSEKE